MFTGLVESKGEVVAVERLEGGVRLTLKTSLADVLARGDSVSVSGACLTVTTHDAEGFTADVMEETLRRTTLGELAEGGFVNLELPLAADGRLDGHVVQGHVDGIGEVVVVEGQQEFSRVLRIAPPKQLIRLIVEKGSITVDGVSLTVSAIGPEWFEVSLIPETLEGTTLGVLEKGAKVNVEADILAKHVERLLQLPQQNPQ